MTPFRASLRRRLQAAPLVVIGTAAALALFGICSVAARAQELLVQTTTFSAAREAVRVYAHLLRIEGGDISAVDVRLPGQAFVAPLTLTRGRDSVAVITSCAAPGYPGEAATFLTALSLREPWPFMESRRIAPVGNALRIAQFMPVNGADESLSVLTRGGSNALPEANRVETWRLGSGASPTAILPAGSWLLPGSPLAALAIGGARIAVLCDAAGASVLHVRDLRRGEVLIEALELEDGAGRGGALAVSRDGSILGVLTRGVPEGRSAPVAVSRVYAVATDTFDVLGPPLVLSGWPVDSGASVQPGAYDDLWIVTRDPSASACYLTRVTFGGETLAKTAEYSFSRVRAAPFLAVAPEGTGLAFAHDNQLELWPQSEPGPSPIAFSGTIGALTWDAGGLFVGEANRLQRVAVETREPQLLHAFQTGLIIGIAAVAGHLPEPGLSGPPVWTPELIAFRAEDVGRQPRVARIEARADIDWRVGYDREKMPWFRANPDVGRGAGWFVAGIDAAAYPIGTEGGGTIQVLFDGPGIPDGSWSRPIEVRVTARRSAARSILWLLDPDEGGLGVRSPEDPYGLKAVADTLAAPPYYFSHADPRGALLDSLSDYDVVVLNSAALGAGMVSRQTLLDYLAGGGAVMLLCSYSGDETPSSLQRHADTFGIRLNTGERVDGEFSILPRFASFSADGALSIRNGAAIDLDATWNTVAGAPEGRTPGVALAVRTVAGGRMAVISSPTPLQADALASENGRALAVHLFLWLAGTIERESDLDADGLIDSIEDRDGDGFVGPGETDKLNPDSDGDGIPDGKEDHNANGLVEEGETSPIHPDSDGDGTLDGADTSPAPAADALRVAVLAPDRCPAEGGVPVTVEGRNFASGVRVWFGGREATAVASLGPNAVSVVAPPGESPSGGPVEVRVEDPETGRSAVLPSGFLYTPRSRVTLSLEAVSYAQRQYSGEAAIRLAAPPGVSVGMVRLHLDTDPPGEVEWTSFGPGEATERAGGRVVRRATREWGIALDVIGPIRGEDCGEIVALRWQDRWPRKQRDRIPLVLRDARVYAPNAQPIDVLREEAAIEFSRPSLPSAE